MPRIPRTNLPVKVGGAKSRLPIPPSNGQVVGSTSSSKLNWAVNIQLDDKDILYLSDLTLLALLQREEPSGLTKEDFIHTMFYEVYQNERKHRHSLAGFASFLEKRINCLLENGFIELKGENYCISDLVKTKGELTPAQEAVFAMLKEAGADGADIPKLIQLFNTPPSYSKDDLYLKEKLEARPPRSPEDPSLYYEVFLHNLWILRAKGFVTSETLVGSGGIYKISQDNS